MNTKERISELRKRLMDINYSSTRITAAWWSEEVRAEVGKEKKEIQEELRKLIPKRITELEEERAELEKKYSPISRMLYKIIRLPKKVGENEEQINRILLEKEDLISIIC